MLLAVDRVWVEKATSRLRVRYSTNWTTTPARQCRWVSSKAAADDCMWNAKSQMPNSAMLRKVEMWSCLDPPLNHHQQLIDYPTGRFNHNNKFLWNRLITFAVTLLMGYPPANFGDTTTIRFRFMGHWANTAQTDRVTLRPWPLTLEVMTLMADAGRRHPSVYQVWSSMALPFGRYGARICVSINGHGDLETDMRVTSNP